MLPGYISPSHSNDKTPLFRLYCPLLLCRDAVAAISIGAYDERKGRGQAHVNRNGIIPNCKVFFSLAPPQIIINDVLAIPAVHLCSCVCALAQPAMMLPPPCPSQERKVTTVIYGRLLRFISASSPQLLIAAKRNIRE